MNFTFDLISGVLIFVLFWFISSGFEPKFISRMLNFWKLVMLILLIAVTIYAYNNVPTYPGLGGDSRYYDYMAHTLSKNMQDGEFSFKLRHDVSQFYKGYAVRKKDIVNIPYGFVVPLSVLYLVIGYNSVLAKVLNVIIFYFAVLEFYKLLLLWKPDSTKHLFKVVAFFAFWPPLMIHSVSLVKETLLMLAYVAFLRALLEKKYVKMFIWMALGLLIRPYTFPVVLLVYFILKYKEIALKYKIGFLFISFVSIYFFTTISFEYMNFDELINERTYSVQIGPGDTMIQGQGAFNLFKTVFTKPVFFLKYQTYSLFYTFLLPKPWVLPFTTASKYVNVGTINFSGIAYWIHSIIWYGFNYIFILILLNLKKIKFQTLKFELISFFTLITIIPLLRQHEVRYIIMTVWPMFLVMYYRVGYKLKFYKSNKQLAFLIWAAIVGYTFYLDFF